MNIIFYLQQRPQAGDKRLRSYSTTKSLADSNIHSEDLIFLNTA